MPSKRLSMRKIKEVQDSESCRSYIICYRAISDADSSGESFAVDSDPELTLALLKSARSVVFSQSIGNRTVRQSLKMDWEGLNKI